MVERFAAQLRPALQGSKVLGRGLQIDFGVAHLAVGQHPAPLDQNQGPSEVFGDQQLERGVGLWVPSATLQGIDSAPQATHVASLGPPIAFLGVLASATSRSGKLTWAAQISPTPPPLRPPGWAWRAFRAMRGMSGGYIPVVSVSKIYRPRPARDIELLVEPKLAYTSTLTRGCATPKTYRIGVPLGRRIWK